jgi:hypothetical protein
MLCLVRHNGLLNQLERSRCRALLERKSSATNRAARDFPMGRFHASLLRGVIERSYCSPSSAFIFLGKAPAAPSGRCTLLGSWFSLTVSSLPLAAPMPPALGLHFCVGRNNADCIRPSSVFIFSFVSLIGLVWHLFSADWMAPLSTYHRRQSPQHGMGDCLFSIASRLVLPKPFDAGVVERSYSRGIVICADGLSRHIGRHPPRLQPGTMGDAPSAFTAC